MIYVARPDLQAWAQRVLAGLPRCVASEDEEAVVHVASNDGVLLVTLCDLPAKRRLGKRQREITCKHCRRALESVLELAR